MMARVPHFILIMKQTDKQLERVTALIMFESKPKANLKLCEGNAGPCPSCVIFSESRREIPAGDIRAKSNFKKKCEYKQIGKQ